MRILPVIAPIAVLTLMLGACSRKEPIAEIPSVAALEADPILLSRVLDRCNARPSAVNTPECVNVRAAVERRSAGEAAARAKRAESSFEMAREARRRTEEAIQQSHDALQKRMSPYELPVEGADDKPAP